MKFIVGLLVATFLAATVAPTLATGDWYDTRTRAELSRPKPSTGPPNQGRITSVYELLTESSHGSNVALPKVERDIA